MGKNQIKLLKARYLTDIVARWKIRDAEIRLEDLDDRLQEFRRLTSISDHEYAAFIKNIEDAIYNSEIAFYQDQIKHKREDIQSMRAFIHHTMTPFGQVKQRLLETANEWQKKENDELFETQIQLYQRLLTTEKATLDDIYDRVANDMQIPSVKRRLFATIELWARERRGPMPALDRFAKDNQNIHTFVIANQTNDMLEALKQISVPPNQKTMQEILGVWKETCPQVEQDIRAWARNPTIVEKDDYLYRNTLRSVWSKIKTYDQETQAELAKRLYEECQESVGMCAQGHISRLTNVFAGFDDRCQKPETFQDTMAAVSLLEISEEQKKAEAIKIMDQMNMPLQDRNVWLEAF